MKIIEAKGISSPRTGGRERPIYLYRKILQRRRGTAIRSGVPHEDEDEDENDSNWSAVQIVSEVQQIAPCWLYAAFWLIDEDL